MTQKRKYHEARMFSVELSSMSQLLSESSPTPSSTNAPLSFGIMHGSYSTAVGVLE